MRRISREKPICQKCGKFLKNGGTLCIECQAGDPPFFIARAVGPYEGCFRKVVKIYKFLEKRGLAVKMSKMMAEVVMAHQEYRDMDRVVPVPMTHEGLARRGFNQSELLAARIARHIGSKHDPRILVRVRETPSQRELSREEREKNLLGAFAVQGKRKIRGKKILLVDDVYTTGSTAKECTRSLMEAGAEQVNVITWAAGKGF